MNIGTLQIEASYEIAKNDYQSHTAKTAGAKQLQTEHGMNLGSAHNYIKTFRCMMDGTLFMRTINVAAADHYFGKILSDFGPTRLQSALSSMQQHIEYYEGHTKTILRKLRTLVLNYTSQLTILDLSACQSAFNQSVENALKDSPEVRASRLKNAPEVPRKITVTTDYFLRNRDVVAAVLVRAAGVCETCGKLAPFQRKSDGTPYLEVHHKQQLAKGGKDVVANAVAVCPNCHRKAHFGAGA